jgi:hypothetical protein
VGFQESIKHKQHRRRKNMDTTAKYKIFNIDNEGMSDMFSKIFWQTREANTNINDQQNEIKQAALELYEKFKGDYKKLNRAKAHFGRISEMELEEEAHNYAMTKTFTFFCEFAETDQAITERFLNLVNDAPTSFFNALRGVLGEEK